MKKLLHRCNTSEAIENALGDHDGFECDARLHRDGQHIILSHEPGYGGVSLEYALGAAADVSATIAINVKEHGLARWLAPLLEQFKGVDYFLFDVPGVDMPHYAKLGLKVFGRHSLYETQSALNGGGVLLDPFEQGDDHTLEFNNFRQQASARQLPLALISHGCHGRFGVDNRLDGVDYLIGKDQELLAS